MKIQRGRYTLHRAGALAALGLSWPDRLRGAAGRGSFQNQPKEPAVTNHARGTFDVKVSPQAPEEKVGDPTVGRMALDKQFHGDLEATSKGQMLAVGTEVKGSAGYVAMERVAGTLKGHTGTFALQHSGTMTRGTPSSRSPWCPTPAPASSPGSPARCRS